MENSSLTLCCWEAEKTSTDDSLKGLDIRMVGSSHREDGRRSRAKVTWTVRGNSRDMSKMAGG